MSTTLPTEDLLREALIWCLTYGVKAVNWNTTGYWQASGCDGADIMPPPALHVELHAARTHAINAQATAEAKRRK